MCALTDFTPGAINSGQSPEEIGLRAELADLKKMNEVRDRVDSLVRDSATAEALKPWYRYLCKRPAFSDTYLQTFNRPNVTLIDTNGAGVDAFTDQGLLLNGVEYKIDCIIFGTGFEVGPSVSGRVGFEIVGRHGESLTERWSKGFKTLHGMISHGFPNLFFTGVNQNGLSFVFTYSLASQAEHIVALIEQTIANKWSEIEPTAKSERDCNDVITQTTPPTRTVHHHSPPG